MGFTTLEHQRAWWAKQTSAKRAEYKRRYNAKIKAAKASLPKKPHKFKNREPDYGREWRARNPEKVRAHRLNSRRRREERYAAEAGRSKPDVCDICGERHGNIVYDHCHRRGHFRGFLCDRCNTVLGLLDDDPKILAAMITYLRSTRISASPQFTLPGI